MFKVASGLTRLFQKPASQEAAAPAKALEPSIQERSLREFTPEELAGSGLTQAREEFARSNSSPG
jgi:hypothetical protein